MAPRKKTEAPTPKTESPLTKAHAQLLKIVEDDPIVQLDPDSFKQTLPHVPTGSLAIDNLIGGKINVFGVPPCPGWPRGRINNLYGNPGAGKTTLALTTSAGVCAAGGSVLYVDYEHEVETRYAKVLGVPVEDPSKFQLLQPSTLEDGMKAMILYAMEGTHLIVVDSVGAGVPSDCFKQSLKDLDKAARVGLMAQKWSQFIPKYKTLIARSNTCTIGISQLRKLINKMGMGPDSDVQGGEAWKYYSSVRLRLSVIMKEKGPVFNPIKRVMEDQVVAALVRAKLDKCKVADTAHHEIDFYLRSGTGIDNERTIIDVGILYGIIRKSGNTLTLTLPNGEEVRGVGMAKFRAALRANPGASVALVSLVAPKLGGQDTGGMTDEPDPEAEEKIVDDLVADLMGTIEGAPNPDAQPEPEAEE